MLTFYTQISKVYDTYRFSYVYLIWPPKLSVNIAQVLSANQGKVKDVLRTLLVLHHLSFSNMLPPSFIPFHTSVSLLFLILSILSV